MECQDLQDIFSVVSRKAYWYSSNLQLGNCKLEGKNPLVDIMFTVNHQIKYFIS